MASSGWSDRILVATDGSASSVVAQKLTAFVAKKFKSKVTVIHAVFPEAIGLHLTGPEEAGPGYVPIWWGGRIYFPRAREVVEEITESPQQRGTAIVADAVAHFREEGIEVNQRIENADPAEAILNEAEIRSYDLIAMGSGGETKRERRLGNVTKKVSLHAKTSVLIARERTQISKILVPVDGSENSKKAFEHAVALARKTDSRMTLVNVLEPGFFNMKPELSKEIGSQILSRAADKANGVKIDQKLESGDPAETVVKIAHGEEYDLIVMGSRGHGAIERWLLGSVSDHVIQFTGRSVLLVK
ncbi:MAG TPA: universal stress protein [candidate division Zixibacteria bacterium]|nr:universal stress protein [candidate division Zixibacteria bacterium]